MWVWQPYGCVMLLGLKLRPCYHLIPGVHASLLFHRCAMLMCQCWGSYLIQMKRESLYEWVIPRRSNQAEVWLGVSDGGLRA
jgi:hypothetical protein